MPLRSAALFLLMLCASAQTARVAFDVAAVRPSDPKAARTAVSGIRVTGNQISIGRIPMKQIIRTAYGVQYDRIEGPTWTAASQLIFDIEATLPAGIRASQLPLMLQSLLEERFKLSAQWGTRVGDYYALVVGPDGGNFTKLTDDPADFSIFDWGTTNAEKGIKLFQSGSTKTWTEPSGLNRVQMATFEDVATLLNPHFGGVPVVDKTGLRGTYDLKLQYMLPDTVRAQAEGKLTSELISDVRDQMRAGVIQGVEKMGLKIEKRRGEIAILVIDKLEKLPTEN